MSKYIDAEKLIERLEEMKRAEYENCGGVNSKTGALQEVQELIASLQQEQPAQVADASKMERLNVDTLREWSMRYAPGFREMIEDTAYHFWNLAISARKEQPEPPTCKSCGFYENNCPFIRDKFIPYPNRVCKDYTFSVMK